MPSKSKLKEIWNQVPPDYYQKSIRENPFQKYWHTEKLKVLVRILGKRKFKTILDVGAASGRMTNEISKLFPMAKISAVDVYKKAVDYGKKKYPHIKFFLGDAHKLPFKNNSFDLVTCYETIEHVVNPQGVIKELMRVVKKGGVIVLAMDSGSRLFRIIWWFWENTKGRVWKSAHLHPFKHWELEEEIKKTHPKIKKKVFSHFGMEVAFLLKK